MLRSRQSKNFLSRQAQKRFGRRSLVLRSPQLQKKCVPRTILLWSRQSKKTFGQPRRKNFGRWSLLPHSRQLLKRFRQRSHVLLLNQSKQNFGRWTLQSCQSQNEKIVIRARCENASVGGNSCFVHPSRSKTAVGGHF